ncbi:hypothetical protein [Aeromicrobium fastidiosum]|uniref:Uncharacterized protein n=1 Tax=Aeromicrobium fastidiosum TaxID=52699 RepID=A0A641AQG3_9ACTN|nr:hypothetical protein [Aeromicrobium fastidiosum]KAA1379922.1 hypothetical protein ESP62_001535 [Aeromicrobium fastidiosum]MBP2389428.1 hypothetical protein [Aeromicrobium fastidiosum]
MDNRVEKVSDAVERLAVSLAESGAVPVPELIRALERAAERLRSPNNSVEVPADLVSQADAARSVGVSRQAVNQWARKGLVSTYPGVRNRAQVSLAEVAIAAHQRTPPHFGADRRHELMQFLELTKDPSVARLADDLDQLLDVDVPLRPEEPHVLREFVVAAMDAGNRHKELSAEGERLLAELEPRFRLDVDTSFGQLVTSLGLVVTSAHGHSGFDSASSVVLGLLGAATVGTQHLRDGSAVASGIAHAAREVWGDDWPGRLHEAAYRIGMTSPAPLVRFTESMTHLDAHRFLRQAQPTGVSISYSRRPGPLLPEWFHGSNVYCDVTRGRRLTPTWAFEASDAEALASSPGGALTNPFRVFAYEHALLDSSVHGVRRYCFSATDARAAMRSVRSHLGADEYETYLRTSVETLATTLAVPHVELAVVEDDDAFDWWKDHIIRASEHEVLLGLHDPGLRGVAHSLLVQTSALPAVVEAADNALRDRLRIYVKNLEFDVIDARYRDDLRRGRARIIKAGGVALTIAEASALAEAEIEACLR